MPRLILALIALLSPVPAMAQRAGALLSVTPIATQIDGARAWRITYETRDSSRGAIRATGILVAPAGGDPRVARRVIAWTHGTWGVVERCAPSLSPNFWTATPALRAMVERGNVVVAPDYPGLGSPGPHPFLIGVDTARSVLDAVRAARAIKGARAGANFAVWGESQGGHAALWTAIEAPGYAPDLRLVATAAAAPPTDLAANLDSGSDVNARALLTAFALHSWSQRFGSPLTSVLSRANAGVATRLARNNCVTLNKTPRLGTILGIVAIRKAIKAKPIGRIAPWSGVAAANSVPAGRIAGPLLIAQGEADPIVAPAVTRAFVRAQCRAGGAVRFISLPGGDHANSARDSSTATLDWIDAAFAGRRGANDCGKV